MSGPQIVVVQGAPQKDVGVAYLLWFFLGAVGAHKFYLGQAGMGLLYLFTVGLCGLGLIVDLITIPAQVRNANQRALRAASNAAQGPHQQPNPPAQPARPPKGPVGAVGAGLATFLVLVCAILIWNAIR